MRLEADLSRRLERRRSSVRAISSLVPPIIASRRAQRSSLIDGGWLSSSENDLRQNDDTVFRTDDLRNLENHLEHHLEHHLELSGAQRAESPQITANKNALETWERRLNDRDNTARMMRQLAQQIRVLVEQRRAPITPRLRQLVNQLEQEADIETAIAATSSGRVWR